MKIYLLALCILLNITSSILFCIENKSLEWQIIEVFLNLGILLVLGFLFMGEGFLWVIWKFYNEKPWNAWLLVILFITMLLFRNEYLNNAIFAELVILFPKLILLLDDGANFQDDSIKEFFRWAQILLIPSSFSGLLRIMLRPFTVVFCVFCNFAMHYVVLTFNPRPANKSFCLNFNTLFGLLRICTNCRRIFTGLYWCQNCGKKYFTDNFSKWTSGNDHIDESIRDTQKKAIDTTDYIEWIPYSELGDMKRIDEGGFGTIYYTIWKCGGPLTMLRGKIERLWQSLEENNRELGHLDEELSKNLRQHKVAIKILKHSDTNTIEKFVKELKAYIKCVTTLHTNDFQKLWRLGKCYRQFKNADRSALREISGQSDSLVLLSKESSMSSCRMR
ncbi:unnamed protein product [Rhizophagus irregularis]|nr:unnamed protein product [Rhizophagus irregularis]